MPVPVLSIPHVKFLESESDDPFPFHSIYSAEQLKNFLPV